MKTAIGFENKVYALVFVLVLLWVSGCSPDKPEEKALTPQQKEELAKLLVVCTEIFNNWQELKPLLTTSDQTAFQEKVNSFAGKEKQRDNFKGETIRATEFNTELINELATRENPKAISDFLVAAENLKAAMGRVSEHIQQGLMSKGAFSLAYSNRLYLFISRAATNGIPDAQLALSEHYENGEFLPKNQTLSEFWLSEAAKSGSKKAKEKLKPKADSRPEKLTNLRLIGTNV